MKILVVHDAQGNVTSAGVAGDRFAGQVRLVGGEGEEVSEIEIPDAPGLAGDVDEDGGVRHLLDLIEDHRIEVTDNVPRLVPKPASAG